MNCYRKWMHRNQTLNCYGSWEIVFKAPNLCIYYQHLGQQSSQIHCWLPGEGENGPDSALPSQVCCTAGAAGQQKTQGISSPKGAQLLSCSSGTRAACRNTQREQQNQKEQFLVATGLLNQFSYPTVYLQCQSKSNKNPKLSMISNKQTKNK